MFQFQFFQAPRKFLLGTFKEVVILWQRLRVEAREAGWFCLTKVCNKWTPRMKVLKCCGPARPKWIHHVPEPSCNYRRFWCGMGYRQSSTNHRRSTSKMVQKWFSPPGMWPVTFWGLGSWRPSLFLAASFRHRFFHRIIGGFFFSEIWQKRMIWWWYGMSISRAGKVRTWWKSHAWRDWPPKCMLRRAHPIKNIARHFKIQGDIHSGKLT